MIKKYLNNVIKIFLFLLIGTLGIKSASTLGQIIDNKLSDFPDIYDANTPLITLQGLIPNYNYYNHYLNQAIESRVFDQIPNKKSVADL